MYPDDQSDTPRLERDRFCYLLFDTPDSPRATFIMGKWEEDAWTLVQGSACKDGSRALVLYQILC